MTAEMPRVLVVDDDAIVASSIAELLAEAGYETDTAGTMADALAAVEDAELASGGRAPRPYAVIVLDDSGGNEITCEVDPMADAVWCERETR